MKEDEKIGHLMDELEYLKDRYILEYDISLATFIGTFNCFIYTTLFDAYQEVGDEMEEEEGDI